MKVICGNANCDSLCVNCIHNKEHEHMENCNNHGTVCKNISCIPVKNLNFEFTKNFNPQSLALSNIDSSVFHEIIAKYGSDFHMSRNFEFNFTDILKSKNTKFHLIIEHFFLLFDLGFIIEKNNPVIKIGDTLHDIKNDKFYHVQKYEKMLTFYDIETFHHIFIFNDGMNLSEIIKDSDYKISHFMMCEVNTKKSIGKFEIEITF